MQSPPTSTPPHYDPHSDRAGLAPDAQQASGATLPPSAASIPAVEHRSTPRPSTQYAATDILASDIPTPAEGLSTTTNAPPIPHSATSTDPMRGVSLPPPTVTRHGYVRYPWLRASPARPDGSAPSVRPSNRPVLGRFRATNEPCEEPHDGPRPRAIGARRTSPRSRPCPRRDPRARWSDALRRASTT